MIGYIKEYEVHCVGDKTHEEFWIPADKMADFNNNLLGIIQIKKAFYGNEYSGINPSGKTGFKENDIYKQINMLESILNYNYMDFSGTLFVEWKIINLNFLHWLHTSKEYHKVLQSIYTNLLRNKRLFISKELEFQ